MAVKFSKEEQAALDAAGAAWNAANAKGDKAGMEAAHAAAEAIRNGKGYTGGDDGSTLTKLPSGSSSSSKSSGNSGGGQYVGVNAKPQSFYDSFMSDADLQELAKWGAAYNSAGSQAEKDYAHQQAEAVRAKYNFSGGVDGTDFIQLPTTEETGTFSYDKAPTYNDRYSDRIDELLNQILNRDAFSYDAATDPLYAQYRDQYQREGQRAMKDTLGQVSARTGGLASSYAQTAAQQSNQYYMQQLADKIPELYQLAYEMYLDDIDLQVQDMGLLQSVSDTAYDRYRDTMADWRDDRDFAYGVYRDDIAEEHYDTEWQYGLDRDKIEDARYDQEWAHQVAQDALAQSNWEKSFAEEQRQFDANYSLDEDMFEYEQQQDALKPLQGSTKSTSSKTKTTKGNETKGKTGSDIKGSYTGNSSSNKNSGSGTTKLVVDTASVLALGYGPLSAAGLADLVDQGKVTEYVEGNKIKYKRNTSNVSWPSPLNWHY